MKPEEILYQALVTFLKARGRELDETPGCQVSIPVKGGAVDLIDTLLLVSPQPTAIPVLLSEISQRMRKLNDLIPMESTPGGYMLEADGALDRLVDCFPEVKAQMLKQL
jgi:hypothetical protein